LTLNYWPLSYAIFHLFFMLGYPECVLVKLIQVSLYFLTQCFSYLTSIFFSKFFFWKSIFFISISCREWWVSQINPCWLSFFLNFFMTLFVFQFHHFALNYLPLNFVIFSLLFLFFYFKSGLVKLTWVNLHFLSHCFLFNPGLFC